MYRESFILYLLQHFLRCRDLDVGFFLFPFQHFTFPNAHFGLHLSNNGAPQQQVFTHFLPRQCRHESTTESRITPCTQVFNLCASALQRTKIRKREEENDHSCWSERQTEVQGFGFHRSDTASDMFWITINQRQSLARTPGSGSSNRITFCACYIWWMNVYLIN